MLITKAGSLHSKISRILNLIPVLILARKRHILPHSSYGLVSWLDGSYTRCTIASGNFRLPLYSHKGFWAEARSDLHFVFTPSLNYSKIKYILLKSGDSLQFSRCTCWNKDLRQYKVSK